MSTLNILSKLLTQLEESNLQELDVITWAAPVLSFGNLSESRIATLGLNPSNREFVDLAGNELEGCSRRFHTLRSLGINRWSEATNDHLLKIQDSCNNYFTGNPYDGWFRSLDKLIVGTNLSYYGLFSQACHLDLVPYATASKWMELTPHQKAALLKTGGNALGMLLRESAIEVLVLNGRSVIENLQLTGDCKFREEAVADWTLPRRESPGVTGYAYTGKLSQISGIDLGREIYILGYSHNIQSSFGVTTEVKTSIKEWITSSTSAVLC